MNGAPVHNFSAASKESLSLAMLALAVDGNENAQLFLTGTTGQAAASTAVTMSQVKMTALERWNSTSPGFGGLLPWFTVNAQGVIVPQPDWVGRVPSLDNGQVVSCRVVCLNSNFDFDLTLVFVSFCTLHYTALHCTTLPQMIWGLVALSEALHRTRLSPSLQQRVDRYLLYLRSTSLAAFYAGQGKVRDVALVRNASAAPTPDNFATAGGYLDDPYEGELFTQWIYLFGERYWQNRTYDRDMLWIVKRAKLVPVLYRGATTVQRGYWFSAHEQWKYLFMPYLDADIHVKLFSNGEQARADFSAAKGVAGLYACVNNVTDGGFNPNYVCCGVESLGSQPRSFCAQPFSH